MSIHSVKTFWIAVLLVIGLASLNVIAAVADASENFQVVDGVAIYLGMMPAQIVQGYSREHTEASMHGGVPAIGQRIEAAQVTGSVMEIGLGSKQKKFESMRIADGNYVAMPDKNFYHIKLQIHRPGMQAVVEAQFHA